MDAMFSNSNPLMWFKSPQRELLKAHTTLENIAFFQWEKLFWNFSSKTFVTKITCSLYCKSGKNKLNDEF